MEYIVVKQVGDVYKIFHKEYLDGGAIRETYIDEERNFDTALRVAKNIIESVEEIFHKKLELEVLFEEE